MKFGITMGDSSGVGPEIILQSYSLGLLDSNVLIYGDKTILQAGSELLGLDVQLNVVNEPNEIVPECLNVFDLQCLSAMDLTPGRLNSKSGAAARKYVVRAAQDALNGQVDALVTLPMNKEATQMTDKEFSGHTELLAELCGVRDVVLMLATPEVVCSHVSTHLSMEESIIRCKRKRILQVILATNDLLRRFIDKPRIAVCGLNPHAGENGLFGRQDLEEIKPAVSDAVAMGIDVDGPVSGDTVFYLAIRQDQYDGIVCQYHDQGHGPMKLLAFESAVNVTAGLPIVRTSVDHGTAFDIAWQGKAFTEGLVHAINFARKLVKS